jgi:hypothetical protein
MLVFGVKSVLIAREDMVKKGSLHSLQRAKKLTKFCDPHVP